MADADVDVVVLGGGPAGLAAAWRAARAGRSVRLLERAPAVGGMAASFEVAGVRVDTGSHRLHPATPAPVLSLLRELLGDDLQTRPRNGRLRVYERWVGFPLRPTELARTLPPKAVLRIGRDAATRPFTSPGPASYASLLVSGSARSSTTRSTGRTRRSSGGWPARTSTPSRPAAGSAPAASGASPARWSAGTGPDGTGVLLPAPRLRRDRRRARRRGGGGGRERRDRRRGDRRQPGADGVEVSTADGRTARAGHVFSTVPLPVLARLAGAAVPPTGLAFRAMVLVYLVHTGGRWTGYDAHYLPGPQTRVTRLSEPANYRLSPEDPADRSVLCAEIPCAVGDPVWTSTPDDLAELVRDGLRAGGLPGVRLGGVEVRRLPHVYPVYEIGYADRLRPLDEWVDGLDRVTTFGRLGLFAHDNTHHAMAEALDAVAALRPDGTRDPGLWAAARARFATHVVED